MVSFSFLNITDFPVSGTEVKSQLGQFGDYIGGALNPVLSFAALLALIINIQLQIKEFVKTRVELANSASAQADLVFQSEFFSLLSSLEKLVQELHKQRENFSVTNAKYVFNQAKEINDRKHLGHMPEISYIKAIFQTSVSSMLVGRVITLLDLINTVNTENLSDKETKYIQIVKLTLTCECIEFIAVMCNGNESTGIYYDAEKLKSYVNRYAMLDKLIVNDEGFFSCFEIHVKKLNLKKSAFGTMNGKHLD